MQQTEKYKLNLIETSDTFSPAPLNENMETVEAQLQTLEETQANAESALDRRVTVLEGHRIVYGFFQGSTTTTIVDLGFTPEVAFVFPHSSVNSPVYGMAVKGGPAGASGLQVITNGFQVKANTYLNASNNQYVYAAIM